MGRQTGRETKIQEGTQTGRKMGSKMSVARRININRWLTRQLQRLPNGCGGIARRVERWIAKRVERYMVKQIDY